MLKVFSYGGGVQSTAALVLAAQGKIDYQTFLFCNVGEDSEHPDTLRYVHEVAMPYAQAHGLTLLELRKTRRDGSPETVYQRLTRPGSRSIGIPVRMNGNGAPGCRNCTYDFKIAVVDKWLKQRLTLDAMEVTRDEALLFASSLEQAKRIQRFYAPDHLMARVGLGISLDEIGRMKPNVDPDTMAWKENDFPLIIDLPRPFTRQDCIQVIARAGLSIPPKSACIFCPFHTLRRWQQMRQEEPAHFWYSADLEAFINRRRAALGLDPVWFCSKLKPLIEATTELTQASLFDEMDQACESGYCFV